VILGNGLLIPYYLSIVNKWLGSIAIDFFLLFNSNYSDYEKVWGLCVGEYSVLIYLVEVLFEKPPCLLRFII